MRSIEALLKGCKSLFVLMMPVLLLGACQERMTLAPEATVPPPVSSSSIDIPGYVGIGPTPYDGIWEGFLIVDTNKCYPFPVVETYNRLIFTISEGIIGTIEFANGIRNADGFVNKRGIYIARAGLGEVTFAGKISGDRLNGKWDSWGSTLCAGQVDLIRKTGNQYYCVDRISGRPYSNTSECNGIDKLLTKAEFDAWPPSPKQK